MVLSTPPSGTPNHTAEKSDGKPVDPTWSKLCFSKKGQKETVSVPTPDWETIRQKLVECVVNEGGIIRLRPTRDCMHGSVRSTY